MFYWMRFLALGLLVVFAVESTPAQAYNPPYAAIVIDVNTGRVLHSRSADAKRYPASITKVMTLYLLFEELEAGRMTMNTRLRVSRRAASQPPVKLGLRAGSTISVSDAIHALIIRSSNDVAVVVAENVSGSVEAFAQRMNRTARRIGMKNTNFRNPSGLPDRRQTSTARDLATLGIAIFDRFPQYYELFGKSRFRYGGRTLTTTNRLVATHSGVEGMKTGFIRASGFNLLTSYRRNGRHLMVVVLGGRSSAHRNNRVAALIRDFQGRASRQRTRDVAVFHPLPPRRPVELGGTLPTVLMPLPPRRPADLN